MSDIGAVFNPPNLSNLPLVTTYGGNTTSGQGLLPAVATSTQSKTNLAPASFSYTPPPVNGTYLLLIYLNISTATTITFHQKVTYKDQGGVTQNDSLVFTLEGSTSLTVGPNTADRYVCYYPLDTNNSATAITVADNAGTYTTCVYALRMALVRLI